MLRQLLRGGSSVSARLMATESSAAVETADDSGAVKLKKIGRALETYLRHSRDHSAMLARERAEFDLGRRHLANMMGMDEHALTQGDIDKAIEYLFPSALSDPNARPVMRSPDEILPRFHRFTFDDEGRPSDSRFFTLSPKFYALMSEVGVRTQNVSRLYYERLAASANAANAPDMQPINLSGSTWLDEDRMKRKLGEKFSTEMYAQLMMALEHLASLNGSTMESKFIMEWRAPLAAGSGKQLFGPEIPEVELDADSNRRTATVKTRVKDTRTVVEVRDAGSGQWNVDGHSLAHFASLQARETLVCPLIVAGVLGRVDVAVSTEGSAGDSALPRSIRHGVALGIAALYPDTAEKLRLAGLLTSDPRKKERSKVNQPGARAKWIWKRR